MAKLCLGVFLLFGFSGFADSQWESAVRLLEQSKPAEAVPLLEAWLADAKTKGIRSPEAQYNLALAHVQLEQWAPGVFYLASSAAFRSNPIAVLAALQNISRIQNRLALQSPVSDQWQFRLKFFLKPVVVVLALLIAFWCLLYSFIWVKMRTRLLLSAWLALSVAGGVGFFVRFLPNYGVLFVEQALEADGGKLAELAPGTLLQVNQTQGDRIQVVAPFAGWLPEASVKLIPFR